MNREEIINKLMELQGRGEESRTLYERYSTSQLKSIMNDLLTFRVAIDPTVNNTIIFTGIMILLIIYIAQ